MLKSQGFKVFFFSILSVFVGRAQNKQGVFEQPNVIVILTDDSLRYLLHMSQVHFISKAS